MSCLFRSVVMVVALAALPACVEFGAPDQSNRVVQLDWSVVGDTGCGPVRELEVRFAGGPAPTQVHAVDCEDARAVFASVPQSFEHVTVVALGDDGVELDRTAAALPEGSEVSVSVDLLQ